MDFLESIAFRMSAVALATAGAFVMAPPTMTMEAPALRASATVSELMPPAAEER